MNAEIQCIQLSPPAFKIYTDDSAKYKIKKILEHRKKACGYEFRVHWKGYNESEDTWLITTQLKNASHLLEAYKKRTMTCTNSEGL